MKSNSKKILVTGAEGFIGSHLVERLVREGASVTATCLYNSFNSKGWLDTVSPEIINNVEVISTDVRDPFAMKKAVEGCQVVLHLAALIAIPYSYAAPQSYVETNITGTLNLLEAAKDAGVEHFVHTSTSEVYGTAQYVPIDEAHPLQPQSPYSASKIAADGMALSYYNSFDLPVTVIRPFNTYGPRQSLRAVIPTVISQILLGQKEIHLGALTPTRDFTYVSDTVSGFLAFIDNKAGLGRAVNLGTGFEISIQELVMLIADILSVDVKITSKEERLRPDKSEVERLLSDNRLASELMNWRPATEGLEGLRAGLEQTIAWFSEPRNLDQYRTLGYVV